MNNKIILSKSQIAELQNKTREDWRASFKSLKVGEPLFMYYFFEKVPICYWKIGQSKALWCGCFRYVGPVSFRPMEDNLINEYLEEDTCYPIEAYSSGDLMLFNPETVLFASISGRKTKTSEDSYFTERGETKSFLIAEDRNDSYRYDLENFNFVHKADLTLREMFETFFPGGDRHHIIEEAIECMKEYEENAENENY
jgi:hypothetical protein